jgi:uncharacterized metal-binding protein
MQNQGTILRLIVLIILNIIVLALVVAVLNFTYAQQNLELDHKTLYYLYKNPTSSKDAYILLGDLPSAVDVDTFMHRVSSYNIFEEHTRKNI